MTPISRAAQAAFRPRGVDESCETTATDEYSTTKRTGLNANALVAASARQRSQRRSRGFKSHHLHFVWLHVVDRPDPYEMLPGTDVLADLESVALDDRFRQCVEKLGAGGG